MSPRPPARLRASDAAALLGGLACLVLWISLTDGIYRYLRPSMRPWLVASGVFLAALALAAAATVWRDGRRGATGRRGRGAVGWFLVLPLVVAVSTDPGALGAFAVRQQNGANYVPTDAFDLEGYLRAHTTGGQVPALKIRQFLAAAAGSDETRALLADTEVRLTGFVVHDDEAGPGGFTLARLIIGCCAGDAAGVTVAVRGHDGDLPAEEAWVEVTGVFDEALTARQPHDEIAGAVPVVTASSVRPVAEPREPYEYPG